MIEIGLYLEANLILLRLWCDHPAEFHLFVFILLCSSKTQHRLNQLDKENSGGSHEQGNTNDRRYVGQVKFFGEDTNQSPNDSGIRCKIVAVAGLENSGVEDRVEHHKASQDAQANNGRGLDVEGGVQFVDQDDSQVNECGHSSPGGVHGHAIDHCYREDLDIQCSALVNELGTMPVEQKY